jgi:carboxyl-terminal processing protease
MKKSASEKLIILVLLLLSFYTKPLQAQNTNAAKPQISEDSQLEARYESFKQVWQTINDKHFDPTFGGIDWKKIREIYEPKAMSAKSLKEFHEILNKMVGELKLSHFAVYEQNLDDLFKEIQPTTAATQTKKLSITGIEIKIVENKPVIFKVEEGSNAEKAGLKPGYVIEKINGKTVEDLFKKVDEYLAQIHSTNNLRKMYLENVINALTKGEPGTKLELTVIDETNKPKTAIIERYLKDIEFSQPVGYFPPQPVIFESKRLEDNIGYIRFNIWTIPQMQNLRNAIKNLSDTKGIIFDLRGNAGGISGIALGLAGLLTDKKISLGKMKGRNNELEFIVYPQMEPYLGKVIILIDYATASTSEIFAVGLKENGRAIVVGERSAGAALPSVIERLPTGAFFQYAIMDYKTPQNNSIETIGVEPDLEILQTRESLLSGEDSPLKEALKLIKQQTKEQNL